MQLPLVMVASLLASVSNAFITNNRVQSCRNAFVPGRVSPLFAESIDEIEEESKDRMAKSVDSVRVNLGTIRTGRANSAILDRIKVKYYGVDTPLNQMASISVPSGNMYYLFPGRVECQCMIRGQFH